MEIFSFRSSLLINEILWIKKFQEMSTLMTRKIALSEKIIFNESLSRRFSHFHISIENMCTMIELEGTNETIKRWVKSLLSMEMIHHHRRLLRFSTIPRFTLQIVINWFNDIDFSSLTFMKQRQKRDFAYYFPLHHRWWIKAKHKKA